MTPAKLRAVLEADRDLLIWLADYFDGRADVIDGPDGEPRPNDAMRLLTSIRQRIGEIEAMPGEAMSLNAALRSLGVAEFQ